MLFFISHDTVCKNSSEERHSFTKENPGLVNIRGLMPDNNQAKKVHLSVANWCGLTPII